MLLASAAVLAACGKGQQSITRTVTAQAAEPSEKTPPSGGSGSGETAKARALAFAQAVNLRAGDVPGFRASGKERKLTTPAERQSGVQLQRCIGGGAAGRALGEQSSPSFRRGATIAQQSVSSSVTVARSATIAAKELSEIQSAHARSCFVRYLQQLFKGGTAGGTSIGAVSVAHGTPPAPNGGGSFGLRISTTILVRSVRIPFYMDILGFVSGSAEISLQTSGIPVPFPGAAEQQLYTLLLARAKAHGA